jgi:hypothetical protein
MSIVKCNQCGTEFNKLNKEIKRSKKHFCSSDCDSLYRQKGIQTIFIELECDFCGKLIKKKNRNIFAQKNIFCSKDCQYKFKSSRFENRNIIILYDDCAGIVIPNKKQGNKICLIDKEDIEKTKKYNWNVRNNKNTFYCQSTSRNNPTILLHRMLMDCPSNKIIDHINHNGLDNRKENLRICTHLENNRNRIIDKRNKSGYAGVQKYYNKWQACITVHNEFFYLGLYKEKQDAINARKQAELKHRS